jgi:hypothetical protein
MFMIPCKPRLPDWIVKEDNFYDARHRCLPHVCALFEYPASWVASSLLLITLPESSSEKIRDTPLTEYQRNIGCELLFVNHLGMKKLLWAKDAKHFTRLIVVYPISPSHQ